MTLVELLAVTSIIAALLVILVPAVQAARESARRTRCANNLREISVAMLAHESSHAALPPGSFGNWNGNGSFPAPWADHRSAGLPWGHFSWAARILPHLDAQPLHDTIDFSVPAYAERIPEGNGDLGPGGHPANREAASRQPPVFVCPSARRVQSAAEFKDYGVNGGTGRCCPERTQHGMDGVAFIHSRITLGHITDGTANTVRGPQPASLEESLAGPISQPAQLRAIVARYGDPARTPLVVEISRAEHDVEIRLE